MSERRGRKIGESPKKPLKKGKIAKQIRKAQRLAREQRAEKQIRKALATPQRLVQAQKQLEEAKKRLDQATTTPQAQKKVKPSSSRKTPEPMYEDIPIPQRITKIQNRMGKIIEDTEKAPNLSQQQINNANREVDKLLTEKTNLERQLRTTTGKEPVKMLKKKPSPVERKPPPRKPAVPKAPRPAPGQKTPVRRVRRAPLLKPRYRPPVARRLSSRRAQTPVRKMDETPDTSRKMDTPPVQRKAPPGFTPQTRKTPLKPPSPPPSRKPPVKAPPGFIPPSASGVTIESATEPAPVLQLGSYETMKRIQEENDLRDVGVFFRNMALHEAGYKPANVYFPRGTTETEIRAALEEAKASGDTQSAKNIEQHLANIKIIAEYDKRQESQKESKTAIDRFATRVERMVPSASPELQEQEEKAIHEFAKDITEKPEVDPVTKNHPPPNVEVP